MKIIIAAVAIMLIIGGVVVFVLPAESAEEQTAFGSWKTNFHVVYADGGTETLAIANLGMSMLALFQGGREIESITYELHAKAIGKGYAACEFDFSSFTIGTTVEGSTTSSSPTYGITYYLDDNTIPLDDIYSKIFDIKIDADDLESHMTEEGDHKIRFIPEGTIRFRGIPSGDWAEPNIPSEAYLTLTTEDTGDYEDPEDPNIPPAEPTYTLTVITNLASVDVTVLGNLYEDGTKTGSNGRAVFTGLRAGSYLIQVSKLDYKTLTRTIDINSDTSTSFTLISSHPPVPDEFDLTVSTSPASCTVTISGAYSASKSSGVLSYAKFTDVPKGQYTIVVTKSGYVTRTVEQYVSKDVAIQVSLTKIPSGAETHTLTVFTLAPAGHKVVPGEIDCGGVTKKFNVDYTEQQAYTGIPFVGLEDGIYRVYAEAPFARGSLYATISGSDLTVTIQMEMVGYLSVVPMFNLNRIDRSITQYYQDEEHYLGEM